MATWSWSTIRRLCSIFCCPPLPSRIAAKLAFVPPEPTYTLVHSSDEDVQATAIRFSDRADWQYSQHELECIVPFTTTTARGERIACIYIKCPASICPRYTILFSHGNAVDVGQMASFLVFLGARLQCDILTYDYSG